MGVCGCGAMNIIDSFKVGKYIMAIDEYLGCEECFAPMGFAVHIFTPAEAKIWLDKPLKGLKEFKPKHNLTNGKADEKMYRLIGKAELVKAAIEIEEEHPSLLKDYETLSGIMTDFGLTLLQKAMEKR